MNRIYLDNNATTPLLPQVIDVMTHCLRENFGNPSSDHFFGEQARRSVDVARERVAALLSCPEQAIVFTSGGTESNNSAILGAAAAQPAKKHIITSVVEHTSVLTPIRFLARRHGYEVDMLGVDQDGMLDMHTLSRALRPETLLVSLMAANNETGVCWPLETISAICRDHGCLFHCDAAQYAGKAPIDLSRISVDLLTVAAHKFHGPKGIGALYIKRGTPLEPFVIGAGQEGGRRGGTENVPALAGFGEACRLAAEEMDARSARLRQLTARLETEITRRIPDIRVNGKNAPRLANTLNISFRGCAANSMIQELDMRGIAVSAHSACHSGELDPSHVLAAMMVPEDYLHGALRISMGAANTADDIDALLAILPGIVEKSRTLGL